MKLKVPATFVSEINHKDVLTSMKQKYFAAMSKIETECKGDETLYKNNKYYNHAKSVYDKLTELDVTIDIIENPYID